MDPATVQVYEHRATEWIARRGEATDGLGVRFRELSGEGPVADLGCGAGRYFAEIGGHLIGMDATSAMLALAQRRDRPLVRGDLEVLPFKSGTLAGVFARNSYVHLAKERVRPALAEALRVLRPGGVLFATLIEGDYEGHELPGDDFTGRFFACWQEAELTSVLESLGFVFVSTEVTGRPGANARGLIATARRS
ncbi:MAG: class I SAM-dependent methyltransferase [Acidimicrobiales bacterium]